MSDEEMGDEVYQPDVGDEQDAREGPDLENVLDERGLDEVLDEGYSPPERPFAVQNYGTTAEEQHRREPLELRLRREQPDVAVPEGDGIGDQPGMAGEPLSEDLAGEERAGRIAEPEDGFPSRSQDVIARDVGVNGGAASAEEAALHIGWGPPEEAEEEGEEAGQGEGGEEEAP